LILRVDAAEIAARRERLMEELDERGWKAFITFNSTSVFYLTNFAFIPTERPLGLVITDDNRAITFVPRLEVEHMKETAEVDEVRYYGDYPSPEHPMKQFARVLVDLGLGSAKIGTESKGYGSSWGYEGPSLGEVLPEAEFEVDAKLVERMRIVKSPVEIALIRESARWGNLAHRLLQEYSIPGRGEVEISTRASTEASLAMVRTLGDAYEARSRSWGAHAGFRGQIGANSALPHAITKNITLKEGDVLVTGAGSRVWGYGSELERTMFVGEPTAEQARYFELMKEVQEVAFDAIKPGQPCSTVDKAVMEFYEEHGLMETWRHHTGHALGLLGHEAPFFDIGEETIMEPGMVFSVEPGIYIPGLGGFRHSDTVVVTEDGMDFITYYPRDLESMICG